MTKTIYQQLKDGASAQSIKDAFWAKITETTNRMCYDLGVDLWSADIVKQMEQELDNEITRAESRINKEKTKAIEDKRKELINSYLEYLAMVTNDNTFLELKNDETLLNEFFPALDNLDAGLIKNWNKGMKSLKTFNDWINTLWEKEG